MGHVPSLDKTRFMPLLFHFSPVPGWSSLNAQCFSDVWLLWVLLPSHTEVINGRATTPGNRAKVSLLLLDVVSSALQGALFSSWLYIQPLRICLTPGVTEADGRRNEVRSISQPLFSTSACPSSVSFPPGFLLVTLLVNRASPGQLVVSLCLFELRFDYYGHSNTSAIFQAVALGTWNSRPTRA